MTNENSEKLSKDLQAFVVEQRAEMHAKTTQAEKTLNKNIGKLGAIVQNLSDKVVAPLDAHNVKMGQIVE